MRKIGFIVAALVAPLLAPTAGRANGFDPKTIPADAKWVVHFDVDAARDTKSFSAVVDQLLGNEDAKAKLDQIEQLTGLRIPDDVDDVTLFGKSSDDDAGVVLLHGKLDREKAVDTLQMADEFDSKKYRTYDVYTWLDKDKNQTMYGAFRDDSNVIIGHTEANIESALDAMDGKIETLKADSVLASGARPKILLYIAAKDIARWKSTIDKPNPITSSSQSAWISLTEKGDTAAVQGELRTASADTAGNVRALLEGVKGMLGINATSQNPDPVAKAVVDADKTFATTQKDTAVVVDWPIPIDQFKAIIKAIADKQAAKN